MRPVTVIGSYAEARAQARWLEEYADSRMGEVFIWRYFNQLVIRRAVWGEDPDEAVLNRTVNEEIPAVLDYLEPRAPQAGFLFDGARLGIADAAIAAMFRNAAFARFGIDDSRWPRTAAYVKRVLDTEPFAELNRFEQLLLHTRIAEHRNRLMEAGAPVSEETWGSPTPQRGIMSI